MHAFDRVRHDEIVTQLTQLKIDGKVLRVIKNIHCEQTVTMRVDGEMVHLKNIKCGVRQKSVLSPDRFSPYSELMIMQNLEGYQGIELGGHNVKNLRYADDTVLIAENEEDVKNY